jgi:hypothetical protein
MVTGKCSPSLPSLRAKRRFQNHALGSGSTSPPQEKRVQGRPGGRCTRGSRAKIGLREREKPQVQTETLRPSPRSGLRLIRALLGEPSRLPPSQATMRSASSPTWRQTLGRHDHTTSPSAKSAARQSARSRPPRPVRDDRDTPLVPRRDADTIRQIRITINRIIFASEA